MSPLIKIGLFILVFLFTFNKITFGQNNILEKSNDPFLRRNAKDLATHSQNERRNAIRLGNLKGWSQSVIAKDGNIRSLQRVDSLGLPVYFITHNLPSAELTKTTSLYPGNILGLALNGSSITSPMLAIWDGGAVYNNHVELSPDRIDQIDRNNIISEHSTHIACTMIGKGINPNARGMAFATRKLSCFDFIDDNAEMSMHASSLLISNHAYGTLAGWHLNKSYSPYRWEFYGSWDADEDYKFGYYDKQCYEWDRICVNAPYYLPVKSSGNNRDQNGPEEGLNYYRFDPNGAFYNAGARPATISSNSGFETIATSGNAKNILTVGAVNTEVTSYGNIIKIADYSSCGPTDDGRIKPDLVGFGGPVVSASIQSPESYTSLSGTSMACANISGSLILLNELYSQLNNGNYIRSSTIKGLAIATAEDLGHNGPDFTYGWGLLNMEKAAKTILGNGIGSKILELDLKNNETYELEVTASGQSPLKITLCWTDPEIMPIGEAVSLNNKTPRLVNDLDIRISAEDSIFKPWVLDPSQPEFPASTGDNYLDNVEQISISDPVPGKTYKLKITHKGTLKNLTQPYSLIITGVSKEKYCKNSPMDRTKTSQLHLKFENINDTVNIDKSYIDRTDRSISLTKGLKYEIKLNLSQKKKDDYSVKVYVDWDANMNFLQENECILDTLFSHNIEDISHSILVPSNISLNGYSRLRVVFNEKANRLNGPCNSETVLDYVVLIKDLVCDVGIYFDNQITNSCPNNFQKLKVKIKNHGQTVINQFEINAKVKYKDSVIKTIKYLFKDKLIPAVDTILVLPSHFITEKNKEYIVDAEISTTEDINLVNNLSSTRINTYIPFKSVKYESYYCTTQNKYYLKSDIPQTTYWYRDMESYDLIGVGNNISTDVPPLKSQYYAAVNDYMGQLDIPQKDLGYFSQKTSIFQLAISHPITLTGLGLQFGTAGKILITLYDSNDLVLNKQLISGISQILNQSYNLNFDLPTPGIYKVKIDCLDNTTLFALNNEVYSCSSKFGILNISNLKNKNNNMYVSRISFTALGCSDGKRTQVKVYEPKLIYRQDHLLSNSNDSIQWYFNNKIISGASDSVFYPLNPGKYKFSKTIANCEIFSNELSFPIKNEAEYRQLVIYPIPSSGQITIDLQLITEEAIDINIFSLDGKSVYKETHIPSVNETKKNLDISYLPNGAYIVLFRSKNKKLYRKIVIQHHN